MGITAGVGADYLATPPVLGYRASEGFVRPREFRHTVPCVMLGLSYGPQLRRQNH